jgi:REase_MTES_1575
MTLGDRPFWGPDAPLPDGITRRMMERNHRTMHRGVRVSTTKVLGPHEMIDGAMLRAGPSAVLSGLSAAFLHGIAWYDTDSDIEISRHSTGQGRCRGGVRVVRSDLSVDDVMLIDGWRVTTPIRTAYDLGRRAPHWRALGHLDDLVKAADIDLDLLWRYVVEHPGTRGIRQIRELIPHINALSESPPESWLRLLIVEGELPRPEAQISVLDDNGYEFARMDLGYRRFKIGIEFDGIEFHETADQRAHDAARDARLRRLGWAIVRVTGDRMRDHSDELLNEINKHLRDRGAYR